ncbi:hypothetical protein F8388_011362 [Cannabis sativa]|uniref:NADP-dependent oxidoreductase domain-containing protein n=1 Tax=Cannabis sativa TaxID=3483 RepID=A0A7J6EW10_CANSA|nr:hypothetical protein F8388_011362 [Cannabis sativa]
MDDELQRTFNLAVENGINLFDIADSYGTGKLNGQSEKLLGKFIREFQETYLKNNIKKISWATSYAGGKGLPDDIVIATKFAAYPWRLTPGQFVNACRGSLERIQVEKIGIGQLHWSNANYAPLQEMALWDGLVAMYKKLQIEVRKQAKYVSKWQLVTSINCRVYNRGNCLDGLDSIANCFFFTLRNFTHNIVIGPKLENKQRKLRKLMTSMDQNVQVTMEVAKKQMTKIFHFLLKEKATRLLIDSSSQWLKAKPMLDPLLLQHIRPKLDHVFSWPKQGREVPVADHQQLHATSIAIASCTAHMYAIHVFIA